MKRWTFLGVLLTAMAVAWSSSARDAATGGGRRGGAVREAGAADITSAIDAGAKSAPRGSTGFAGSPGVDAGLGVDASGSVLGDASSEALDGSHDTRTGEGGSDTADARAEGGGEGGRVWASCIEFIPEGVSRPKLTNTFPARGLAGYALTLKVQIEHGLGERVLPNGFHVQTDSDAARALATEGFILPNPDGGSGPSMSRREVDGKAVTDVLIPFVALPKEPGRHELTLPPIPIAISRANGEQLTLCTSPHRVTVDEPIANEPKPAPERNPDPRQQREVWTLARDLTYGVAVGAALAALIAWLVVMWRRRPKKPKPPPPPRPPWEVAFESLDAIRRDGLAGQAKHSEHMDRVSDVVRVYLGARYAFDGIESTTDEVLGVLRRMTPPLPVFDDVRVLLQDSDLAKFARWTPTDADCERVLITAEQIVRATMLASGLKEPRAAEEPSTQGDEAEKSEGKKVASAQEDETQEREVENELVAHGHEVEEIGGKREPDATDPRGANAEAETGVKTEPRDGGDSEDASGEGGSHAS